MLYWYVSVKSMELLLSTQKGKGIVCSSCCKRFDRMVSYDFSRRPIGLRNYIYMKS